MRSLKVLAGAMLVLLGHLAAQAQSTTLQNVAFQANWGVPTGPYQQTCRDIRLRGDSLTASCQRGDGGWNDTSINRRSCSGEISNENGNLRCMSGNGPGGWQGGQPRGDYQSSCRDVRMRGSQMEARCQARDGSWRRTSIDVNSCGGRNVNNFDGNLRCGGGGGSGPWGNGPWGWQGNAPQGRFRDTCQDVRIDGDRLRARCQAKDGRWRDTAINRGECRGSSIVNDDGRLRCQ